MPNTLFILAEKREGRKMQKKLPKFAGVILATLIVLSVLPIIPAFAATPNIYLDPSHVSYTTDTAPLDKKFTVTAMVSDVADLFIFQVALYFNASVINATDAGLPTDYVLAGRAGSITGPAYDYFDSWGVVMIGFTCYAGETPFTGSGKLAEFEFEMIASPPKWGNVTSDLIISYKVSGGVYESKLKDSTGAAIDFTGTDGDYIYEWAPPTTNPWLSVDPDSVLKDQYTNWTDTTFTIDIVLNDVEVAWELVSVSFEKTFNASLLEVVSVTEGGFLAGFGDTIFDYTLYSDYIFINCSLDTPYPMGFPEGTGVIATIEFKIIFQGEFGDNRECDLGFRNIEMLDKEGVVITHDPADPGAYEIKGYMVMPAPWYEAEDVTVGPEPMQGAFADVDVSIKGLDVRWKLVGLQFRLTYDPEILEVAEVIEGPFLPAFGETVPMSKDYPEGNTAPWTDPHVMFGDMLQPPWTVFAEGEGVVATVRFKILKQYMDPDDIVVDLEFIEIKFRDNEGKAIPVDDGAVKNGTLTILGWSLAGRVIDLFTQYPAPYGGQGPDNPSDMFWPQKEVWLYAEVTYNWWPVQEKDVAFEVRDPSDQLWTTLVGRTNETGVALVKFRIPWPCDDPETLFGVWTVTASVDVACEIIVDTLQFHFDYLVRITSVTPDKLPPEYYKHCEYITIQVDFSSHAMQTYPIVFTVVIHDELNVPIGEFDVSGSVGGAGWCQYKSWYFCTEIHVRKFAFAGTATIHVNCLSAFPSEGGSAWCPEETVEIVIYPGWVP